MSFLEYPEYMYEIVNTGGLVELGTYTVNTYKQISNVQVTMLFNNTSLFTNEQVRLSCNRASQSDTITSEWITPKTAITDFLGDVSWIGNLRFDFNRQNLQDLDTLQIFLETTNYSFDQQGTQIGAIINYLDSNGQPEVLDNKAGYLNVFGYQ